MSLTLYNTLTRKKEPFTPIDPAHVRMYVCGPTVYDFAHIGNARPVIVFDVLYRLLRHLYGESHVTYVRNITDVDDKINDRAARDYPGLDLNDAIRKVTESTAAQFRADVAALGCLPPNHEPRATDNIQEMIGIINRLIANGHAYIAQGAQGREVLFEVASMPAYGALSNRKLDEQIEGARVAVEAHKKHASDFVLWKESSPSEPGWTGAFGDGEAEVSIYGRPGWHIECSAMSFAKLIKPFGGGFTCDDPNKNMFDIHGGGIDLVFPHHENEIAQSCCALNTPRMANVWMHNGFLQVEGQKMSKSLGNFVTIHELLATDKFGGQKWDGKVLRLAMLETHYRKPINFAIETLKAASTQLARWRMDTSNAVPEKGQFPKDFINALSDDLNTSLALNLLKSKTINRHDLAKTLVWLGLVDDRDFDDNRARTEISRREMLDVVNQSLEEKSNQALRLQHLDDLGFHNSEIETLITTRLEARRNKNFAESDRIRDELLAMGIQLKDGKDADGNPVTTWEVKR
jgi:cysteinyl-tRNA synthetase